MKGISAHEYIKIKKNIKIMLKRIEESGHNAEKIQEIEGCIDTQYEEYLKLLKQLKNCINNYKTLCEVIQREYRQSMRSPKEVTENSE